MSSSVLEPILRLRGEQIIASAFSAGGAKGFFAVNPKDGSRLDPEFSETINAEIEQAVGQASTAFDAYREVPAELKAAFLESIGEELQRLGKALVSRAQLETALPQQRLEGELTRTVNQLQLIAQHVRNRSFDCVRIDSAIPERIPVPKPDIRTMNVPLGPVAVFGASNFPLAFSVAGGDTASALAAGCPVVVKGHPAHPGTSELAGQAIMQAVEQCKLPPGVFSLLQSSENTAGAALVRHPLIKAVAFTGSLQGGRALFDLACARAEPIPVYAEMGSVNPVFLLPEAVATNTEALAEGLAGSITMGVGQFCTAPGLIFLLKDGSTDHFLDCLKRALELIPAGVLLHTDIRKNYLAGIHRLSSTDGVDVCSGLPAKTNDYDVAPVLFRTDADTYLACPELTDEVFGPAAIVVICNNRDEMLTIAERLPGQLTASVHAVNDDLIECTKLLRRLETKAGRLVMNGFPTGVEVCASMHHGGPYPASTDSRSTSVGTEAVKRFLRPVCYQNFPQRVLPASLRDDKYSPTLE